MSITQLLKFEEGFRAKPYHCTAGKLTIGYGLNLEDRGLTEIEADYLLKNDIGCCVADVSKALPWSAQLDMVRRDVLIAMRFQLGLNGLLSFANFLKDMRDGEWDNAAANLRNSKFYAQVPARVNRLIHMVTFGQYPSLSK